MKAIAQAEGMEVTPHDQLRNRVAATYGRHNTAASLTVKDVSHSTASGGEQTGGGPQKGDMSLPLTKRANFVLDAWEGDHSGAGCCCVASLRSDSKSVLNFIGDA